MFCVKCGTKLDDGAVFCTSCGARQTDAPASVPPQSQAIPQPQQTAQPQPIPQAVPQPQPIPQAAPQYPQAGAPQYQQVGAPQYQQPMQQPSFQQAPPQPPFQGAVPPSPQPPAKPKRKSPLPAILIVLLLLAAVAAGAWYFLQSGGNGKTEYKELAEAYFDAVDKADVNALAKLYEKDQAENLLEDKKDTLDEIKSLQENYVEVAGKKWREELTVGKAEKIAKEGDTTTYNLPVTIGENETSMGIAKVDDRYYVMDAAQMLNAGAAGAGEVILTFFKAIAEGDVEGFKACFNDEAIALLEESYSDDDITGLLDDINSSGVEESGEDWISKISISEVVEDTETTEANDNGRTYYTVIAVIEGLEDESEPIVVFEEDGAFYIDVEAMGMF